MDDVLEVKSEIITVKMTPSLVEALDRFTRMLGKGWSRSEVIRSAIRFFIHYCLSNGCCEVEGHVICIDGAKHGEAVVVGVD